MSDFNLDCKVSGCEREAVDSSGLCSKHKTASDKPEASASVEEIAREAAQDIADSNSQIEPSEYDYQTILAAITAAIAPLQAELEQAKRRLKLPSLEKQMVALRDDLGLTDLQSRLATAEAMLSRIAFPRRGTPDEGRSLQDFADEIQEQLPHVRDAG